MTSGERRAAERFGRLAETVAALRLRLAGYRILARRARTPIGEIDIVARRGRTLAIVEVKARASLDRALDAVPSAQRRRIERAAALLLDRMADATIEQVRFDVIAIAPYRLPRHLPDAWRSGE